MTGASSGIGRATAILLTKKGAKVALTARSKNKLEDLSRDLPGSLVVAADISREKEAGQMVSLVARYFGRVDILVNNAGQGYDSPVEKTDLKKLQAIFDLNLLGPLVAMQKVIPLMRKQGGGVIVNISSGTSLMYLPNMGAYSGLKCTLNAISLTAREELKEDKISVSVVYPYITATDFEENTLKEDFEAEWEDNGREIPPSDSAKYAAQKILEAIVTEKAEIFAHEWMKNRKGT